MSSDMTQPWHSHHHSHGDLHTVMRSSQHGQSTVQQASLIGHTQTHTKKEEVEKKEGTLGAWGKLEVGR